jgi:hypothetical protein
MFRENQLRKVVGHCYSFKVEEISHKQGERKPFK